MSRADPVSFRRLVPTWVDLLDDDWLSLRLNLFGSIVGVDDDQCREGDEGQADRPFISAGPKHQSLKNGLGGLRLDRFYLLEVVFGRIIILDTEYGTAHLLLHGVLAFS